MAEKDLDEVYSQRTDLFLLAMALAKKQGYRTGVRENDGTWVVLSITLGEGQQISIHAKVTEVPDFILNGPEADPWDGSNDIDKHNRIREFIASL